MLATTTPPGSDVGTSIESIEDVLDLLQSSISGLVEGFVGNLPVYLIGFVVFLAGLVGLKFAMRAAEQGLERSTIDDSLRRLTLTLARSVLLIVVLMVALSVAGVDVGAALAAIGLLGLAFVFAFQNILENFIAGILILIRKPFRVGDQIIVDQHEGTVSDINMRITKLTSYAGVSQLLPNADVFRNPLVNLTEQGRRRTTVVLGIDYRDDHDAVAGIVIAAIAGVEGVLEDPAPEVLCTELGASSVDFEVRYWTLPDSRSVRHTQDRVLRATKTAVENAGMTIPWPITTLEPGQPLTIHSTATVE